MIRTILIVFLVACSTIAQAQKHGIGIRLGDPSGITYKNYLSKTRSVEFGLGSVSQNWHWSYYQRSFEGYSQFNNDRYVSHQVLNTIYLQARYLINSDIQIDRMVGKLDWYWGVGAMLKSAQIRYAYQDFSGNFPMQTKTKSDIDLGPEGIVGLEYKFEDIPVSIFGEASLLIELLDRPGVRVFSGIGIRYNFDRLQ